MPDLVRLKVVASQGEADVIRGLLETAGIECAARATGPYVEGGGGFGGWREILVDADDLDAARRLVAETPP